MAIWHVVITFCVGTPLWAKCEDETHTPKSGNLESSKTPKNSKLDCKGQNTSHWSVLYTIEKVLKCRCLKWPHNEPFGHLQPKLWAKKGLGIKLAIWLPTTKSQESTRFRRLKEEWDMALESSQREIQDCFRPHPNRRSEREVTNAQTPGSPNRDTFGSPL
jgi:hypothetical protein